MREDLLREVELELQARQRQNEETMSRRRREIRENYPELAEMLSRREQMIAGAVRGILQGQSAPEDLPARMEETSGEIRAALKRNGFPEDYLAPVYECPLCRDTGFVGETVRERCACVRKRYQQKLREAVGLPPEGGESFESFDLSVFPAEKPEGSRYTQRDVMEKVRERCEEWADSYPHQECRDLLLSGKSGLGKTYLLHAMAGRLIERGVQVLLMSAYSFVDLARQSYYENDGRLEEVIGTEVLMIDDLGSEPMMQNVTVEQLFNLINERQRRNLPTIVSTNLNQEELRQRYTERIASRLTDRHTCLFLPLKGRDIRNGRG